MRDALRRLLDEEFDVLDAASGRAALATVRSRTVDLALLDIVLPAEDGLEVLQKLREIDPGLPVVIITAVKTVRSVVMAMKLGAFEYLTKPFDQDDLCRAIRFALEPPPGPSGAGRRPGAALSPHVRDAVDYLSLHFAESLTVEAVARAVGISWSHLAHLFRAETGMTVRTYLRHARVEAAMQRLASGDEKLAAVARKVGFYDDSHLTRTFLRLTGRPPSSYRRL